MSVAVDSETGVQALPPTTHPRARLTSWTAHCAADADLRTRDPYWREVAGRMRLYPDHG